MKRLVLYLDTSVLGGLLDKEPAELAAAYLAAGVMPEDARDDALHFAIATVHEVDVLVSWNFRHLVNVRVRVLVVMVERISGPLALFFVVDVKASNVAP